MSKDGLGVVNDEFSRILEWNMNERLVIYVIMN